MSTGRFRIAKRAGSFEDPENLDTLIETEFFANGEPDLRLSVYEIEDEPPSRARLYAEHHAGTGLDSPFRTRSMVDLSGVEPHGIIEEEGDVPFGYARNAHRIVPFNTVQEQRALVGRLLAELNVRRRITTKPDAEAYVGDRLVAADREWIAFFSQCDPEWDKYLQKLRQKRSKAPGA